MAQQRVILGPSRNHWAIVRNDLCTLSRPVGRAAGRSKMAMPPASSIRYSAMIDDHKDRPAWPRLAGAVDEVASGRTSVSDGAFDFFAMNDFLNLH